MCYEQKQGRRNEWGVIIPSASPKTDCLKATGPLQPLCLNLRGAFTALTNVELSNVCIRMAEGPLAISSRLANTNVTTRWKPFQFHQPPFTCSLIFPHLRSPPTGISQESERCNKPDSSVLWAIQSQVCVSCSKPTLHTASSSYALGFWVCALLWDSLKTLIQGVWCPGLLNTSAHWGLA